MAIVYAAILFAFLLIYQEVVRRSPKMLLATFGAFVLIMSPYWIMKNNFDWFLWAKTYSVIGGCIWIYFCRSVFQNKKHWPVYVLYFFLVLNIMEAVAADFEQAHYLNAVSGLLLIFTMGSPKRIKVALNSKYKDLHWDLSLLWIIGYTIWNYTFAAITYPISALRQISVLAAPLIISLKNRKIWLQARAFTLALFFLIYPTSAKLVDSISLEKFDLTPYGNLMGAVSLGFMLIYTLLTYKRKIYYALVKVIKIIPKMHKVLLKH